MVKLNLAALTYCKYSTTPNITVEMIVMNPTSTE